MQNPLPELDPMVQPPSDLLERPNESENTSSDYTEVSNDSFEMPNNPENTPSDYTDVPNDLFEMPSELENITSDYIDLSRDLFEMPNEPESVPDEFANATQNINTSTYKALANKANTLKDTRTVATCDKEDLQEIKDFFPSTSFKTVGDLTTHIVKNWRLVLQADESESKLVKALVETNELKAKATDLQMKAGELESTVSTQKAHIANLEAQLANIVPTQAQQPLAGISNEEHEAAIKATEELFKKKVTEIATKVQEEAEKRLFNAVSIASLEALEEVYKQLLADYKGNILTAFTSKLMTREEFFSFFQTKLKGGIENHLAL